MDGDTVSLTKPHRFTVTDYHAMVQAGVLDEDSRVELIDGLVVDMSPVGAPHYRMVTRLNRLFSSCVGDRADVSVQNPVRLDDFSEPQPDIVLIRPDPSAEETTPYRPIDVLLLIEVADSSLVQDRRVKVPLYAASNITEYWIVNIQDRVVEIHRKPDAGRYTETSTAKSGLLDIMSLPGLAVSVDDILRPKS